MGLKTAEDFAPDELLRALESLNRLWNRNLIPEKLERHYFLYWFAVYRGDLVQTAEALRVHQNTVRFHFLRFGFSEKSESLRDLWGKLSEKNERVFFELNFYKFHKLTAGNNELSYNENERLIRLWQTGFSFTAIGAHYMLWALRNHKSKKWVHKKLGYSTHHCMRVLVSLLDPQTVNGRWLALLRPTREEIYIRLPRNSPKKNRILDCSMAVLSD